MSTVAPSKQGPQSGYVVSRSQGVCAITGEPIAPGDKLMAMVTETPLGLERLDFKLDAWPRADKSAALAYWQTVMPAPDQVKRKLFVDDEVLCQLFERLADTTEENKLHFRFVLGLILMRKRLLVYETSQTTEGVESWTMRVKGKEDRLAMINPKLSEEQVKAVSAQLGEIMNEEL
ncbi:MAG: hypothetical protein H7144_03650 [Burkholderiales bacterium]|nr:hypothetical protein [Phycisphaerae bacterium]